MVERKRKSFFDIFFGNDPFEDIEGMFERVSKAAGMESESFESHPFVYGFSMTQRPGEEPEFREFGNIPGFERGSKENDNGYLRKPLTDVLETDDKIHVIAEVPGVEKEDIKLNATDLMLEIETLNGNLKYSEHVELPVKVDPQSAKATYRNGVLEVTFRRLDSNNKTSISIE